MEKMFVKPVDGGMVIDPQSGMALPPEGLMVPRNTYWLRRVSDGSVEIAAEFVPPETSRKSSAGKAQGEE